MVQFPTVVNNSSAMDSRHGGIWSLYSFLLLVIDINVYQIGGDLKGVRSRF